MISISQIIWVAQGWVSGVLILLTSRLITQKDWYIMITFFTLTLFPVPATDLSSFFESFWATVSCATDPLLAFELLGERFFFFLFFSVAPVSTNIIKTVLQQHNLSHESRWLPNSPYLPPCTTISYPTWRSLHNTAWHRKNTDRFRSSLRVSEARYYQFIFFTISLGSFPSTFQAKVSNSGICLRWQG